MNTSWNAAVLPDQERLYKLLVRRAGVTPRRRAAFWEFMVLRRCVIHEALGKGRVVGERLMFVDKKGRGCRRALSSTCLREEISEKWRARGTQR